MTIYRSGSGQMEAFHALTGEPVDVVATAPAISFESGGRQSKQLLHAHIGGVATAFVERPNDVFYARSYKHLAEKGFPVIPGVLEVPERSSVLVPYVKTDGSELYGKALWHSIRGNTEYVGRTTARDQAFLHHTRKAKSSHEGIKAIEAEANHLASLANKHKITLPHDAFDLRVKPDGSADILMVDIGDTLSMESGIRNKLNGSKWNRDRVGKFVTYIGEVRGHISGEEPLEPFHFDI